MRPFLQPTSPTSVARFLKAEGIRPSKRLGQNFLTDSGTIGRIVAASGLQADDVCLEIGAGLGALTGALALTARRVLAVEVDRRLAKVLRLQFASNPVVCVLEHDFLKLDLEALLRPLECRARVVANIPYAVTSPIIERLLEHRGLLSGITLLVQKEVGERLAAVPGSADYSSFSVFCQYHARVSLEFTVARHLFIPRPEVDSCVVRLDPRPPALDPEQEQRFFRILRAAFSQRRKTLLNTLSAGLSEDKQTVRSWLEAAGLEPSLRAEDLSVDDFLTLASAAGAASPP